MAHSISGLIQWLDREDWHEPFARLLALHIEPACIAADVPVEEVPDLIGQDQSDTLWGCVFEDFLTLDLEDGRNIVADYLKRQGWKESAASKAYMAALRSSVMSLYEVSDIVVNESFLARDMLRGGESVRVSERSGTRYLKQWDRIAARLVRVGDTFQMAGGVLPLDYEASEDLLEEIRRARKVAVRRARKRQGKGSSAPAIPMRVDALCDDEVLQESAFLFTHAWLESALNQILHPKAPQLSNVDGDAIAFTSIKFPLSASPRADAVAQTLNSLAWLQPESATFWTWIETRDKVRPKDAAKNSIITTRLDYGTVALGTIELTQDALVLDVNSRERAERGRALIERALGELVGVPAVESRDVAQVMASPAAGESRPGKRPATLTPDAERAIMEALLDKHYAELLDQPIPMLGDISPRKASKTAGGREKLVAWLKFMENMTAKNETDSPVANYDFGWLWQTLGISHLRR